MSLWQCPIALLFPHLPTEGQLKMPIERYFFHLPAMAPVVGGHWHAFFSDARRCYCCEWPIQCCAIVPYIWLQHQLAHTQLHIHNTTNHTHTHTWVESSWCTAILRAFNNAELAQSSRPQSARIDYMCHRKIWARPWGSNSDNLEIN